MGPVHTIDITIPQPARPARDGRRGGGEARVSKEAGRSRAAASKLAVVIMAAGKGTRLKSRRPKVLHEVGGKPLLSHVIAAARRAGGYRGYLCDYRAPGGARARSCVWDRRALHRAKGAARNRARHPMRSGGDRRIRAHPGSLRRRAADPGGNIAAPDDLASGGRCGHDDSDCGAGRSDGLWTDYSPIRRIGRKWTRLWSKRH